MKKNFNLDELDTFLSETVEEHRMYPSDRVWRNIDNELHGNKKWPALTFAAVLTGAIILSGLILIRPDKNLFTVPPQDSPTVTATVSTTNSKDEFTAGIQPQRPSVKIDVPAYKQSNPAVLSFYPELPNITENALTTTENEAVQNFPLLKETVPAVTDPNSESVDLGTVSLGTPSFEKNDNELALNNIALNGAIVEKTIEQPNANLDKASIASGANFDPINTKTIAKDLKTASSEKAKKANQQKNRWNIEYFVTPSISYRYLDEAKIVDLHIQNGGPIAPNLTYGVNNFVRHKSLLGLEAGSVLMYNVTPNFRIKAGLQLNYRAYAIEAYASQSELSTILLDRGAYTDSIIRYSSLSNQGGYSTVELVNRYWQLGIPIGFDLKMASGKKLQLYVAATIAPTYQFNNSNYIITTDYKNYVKQPDLTRQWNINTGIEAFVSFDAGKGVVMQAGPQIRYQILPGTVKQYPIREHLLDYGLKIGFVKTLK